MKFILFIFVIYMGIPSLCLAEDCGDSLNQEFLVSCFKSTLATQDTLLKNSYKLLKNKLSIKNKIPLKNSQLAWLNHRESDCDLEASSLEGPEAYQAMYLSCMIESTKLRTKRMDYLFKQFRAK